MNTKSSKAPKSILFFVNVDWFFLSHRLPIAIAAIEAGYVVHILTGITNKEEELRTHGLIVHPLPINRSKFHFFQEVQTFFKIIRVFSRVKPDLIHLVTIKPVIYGGIASRIVRVKSVVAAISGLGFIFSHQDWKARAKRFLVSIAYKNALQHNNLKVIFQNPSDYKILTKIATLKTYQLTTIPGSGIDLSIYNSIAEPATDEPIIILASRLLHDKGVSQFVEAAGLLNKKGMQARFCLVGTPDLANPNSVTNDELTQWVNDGIVESWGHRTDMPVVLSSANIVVLPSYYGEGLPKVLIEAAACGRAVITTDMPGCRDSIIPDVTGLLIPPKDSEALANSIEHLLLDSETRKKMGQAGRELAEDKYAIEQVIESHLNIYKELMNKA